MLELTILLTRFLFVFYIVYFLYQGVLYVLAERGVLNFDKNLPASKQRVSIIFMHLTAYLILAYIPGTFEFDAEVLITGGIALAFLWGAHALVNISYKGGCPLMWNAMFFLLDIGLITLQRLQPDIASLQAMQFGVARRQLIWFLAGFTVTLFIPLGLKLIPRFEKLEKFYLFAGLVLLLLPTIFGTITNGALNWVNIGSLTLQPSELVKFLFVFYLACAFRKKAPIMQLIIPAVVSAVFICILVSQKDLGGSLIYFMTFMVMLYISSGSELLFAAGLGAASIASVGAYKLFSHVRVRVAAWQNPWQNIDSGGYQVAQSLFAIGTWGLLGSGLTMGIPYVVPVAASDFIFAAICEEMGSIFGVGLIGVYLMIFYRGVHITLRCHRRFYSLLAAGFTGMLSFQTFLILGGNIKLIPLTGVTLPFVSYGGSSILISIMMIGILQWIHMISKEMKEAEATVEPVVS